MSDYRGVNKQIKKVPGVMRNQQAETADLRRATCFGKINMLQGYWQMSLATETQEAFTITTPEGLFTPKRVPQGVLNSTASFQGVMTELLAGLNYSSSFGRRWSVCRCSQGLFFDTEIAYSKVYSGGQVSRDKEHVSGLASMCRPQTAGELMQILQAIHWLRTSLPRLPEVVEPLRVLLEEDMAGFNAGPSESHQIGQSRRKHGRTTRWLRGAMHRI